ncbi:MAG: NAD(P)/FAD-dependent oxidoreductase [Lachnospiraceae bacterium]|nr:NAD(P)/FAD-dependent oxidoreductase [Lachnospiraceae bacterium]
MQTVIVVGGGAAGMMAAIKASNSDNKVILIEHNEKLGKKVFITGKGRCNLTNASDIENIFNNIVSNPKFMYSSLYSFTNEDVIELFESHGMKTKVERGNRVFPASDKSSDVIKTLKNILMANNVDIRLNTELKDIGITDGKVVSISTNKGQIKCDKLILATGGLSYPVTGSDGKVMKLLTKYGHTIKDTRPALVPLNVKEEYVKELQGLSLKNVEASFYRTAKPGKKPVYKEFGEMLFTHFGVTGPVILSASSVIGKYLENEKIVLKIDLKPALDKDKLDARIIREFNENINKDIRNSLDSLLPKSLIPIMIKVSDIDPYKKVHEISKEERTRLLENIKGLTFEVISLRDYNEAIITQGGINVKEVDPTTMESKYIKDLYLAGEMLDLDAFTGGYNLQIAWSTGALAGMSTTY